MQQNNFNKIMNNLSKIIFIPRFVTNFLRTPEEKIERNANGKLFDNLEEAIILISKNFEKIRNSIIDINNTIDGNSNNIDTLIEDLSKLKEENNSKNDKIILYDYSKNFEVLPNNSSDNPEDLLYSTIKIGENVSSIIFDRDSGLDSNIVIKDNNTYLKLKLDESITNNLEFISDSNSSINIEFDNQTKKYRIKQNNLYLYESESPETEIIINHNLGTHGLDIKIFKYIDNDINLKYPIIAPIHYYSDNQIRIFLTEPSIVSVLISRL